MPSPFVEEAKLVKYCMSWELSDTNSNANFSGTASQTEFLKEQLTGFGKIVTCNSFVQFSESRFQREFGK